MHAQVFSRPRGNLAADGFFDLLPDCLKDFLVLLLLQSEVSIIDDDAADGWDQDDKKYKYRAEMLHLLEYTVHSGFGTHKQQTLHAFYSTCYATLWASSLLLLT